MKRFIVFMCCVFICVICHAQTVNIDWKVDGNIYSQSTCEYGADLNVPQTPPTKYGYTFNGWLPYIPIEYLQSNGVQYIDTGYTFNDNIKVVFKANWAAVGSYIFGANSSGGTEQFISTSSGYLMGRRFNISPSIQANVDTIVEIQFYKGNAYAKIDNVLQTTSSSSNSNSSPVVLFAAYNFSQIQFLHMKIYYFKMYQNDVLVRDFIPVIDTNGVYCLFDKVESEFFYNAGTGQFIAGPILQ